MRTYAYITVRECKPMQAALPGEHVGVEDRPVSKLSSYCRWQRCKRETLLLARGLGASSVWEMMAARSVMRLLNWLDE